MNEEKIEKIKENIERLEIKKENILAYIEDLKNQSEEIDEKIEKCKDTILELRYNR